MFVSLIVFFIFIPNFVLLAVRTDFCVFFFFRMGRYTGKKCRLISMFVLTAGYFFVELIVGYVTNSMALVADSFHMLSDVIALIVAYLSVKVSKF